MSERFNRWITIMTLVLTAAGAAFACLSLPLLQPWLAAQLANPLFLPLAVAVAGALLLALLLAGALWLALRAFGGTTQALRELANRLGLMRRTAEGRYLAALLTKVKTTQVYVGNQIVQLSLLEAFARLRLTVPGIDDVPDPDLLERQEDIIDDMRQKVASVRWRSDGFVRPRGWLMRWREVRAARRTCSAPPGTPGFVIWQQPKLVVLGLPGSGKTTLLRHIALVCASELLGAGVSRQQRNRVREVYGWPRALFPIFIPLRQFVKDAPQWRDKDLLTAYAEAMPAMLSTPTLALPPTWLAQRFARGGCVLLIDGFDELRDATDAQKLAEKLRALAELPARRQNYIVLSSRPIGYGGELDADSFARREVAPLSRPEVEAFVAARYDVIYARESQGGEVRPSWDAPTRSAELLDQLAETPQLAELARNPLMLSLVVGIHAKQTEARLPRQRYRVYERACDDLIEAWDKQRQQFVAGADGRGKPVPLNQDEKRELAALLAWSMFDQPAGETLANRARRERMENHLVISRGAAKAKIESPLQAMLVGRIGPGETLEGRAKTLAKELLTDLGERGGLLQGETSEESDDAEIQFAHKSLQEYLAAYACALKPDYAAQLLDRWADPYWQNILRLYAASSSIEPKVIERLLTEATPAATVLAGWCLYEEPRTSPPLADGQRVRQRLHQLLIAPDAAPEHAEAALTILEAIDPTNLPDTALTALEIQPSPVVRARCATLLASMAGDPQVQAALARAADNDDDWRVRRAAAEAIGDDDPRYHGDGLIPTLVHVKEGRFLMGSRDDDKQGADPERPQHLVELPEYWIGRTPVTNAQFRAFAQTDGYTERAYWTEAGWRKANPGPEDTDIHNGDGPLGRFRRVKVQRQPDRWRDPGGRDSHPAVRITWHEAVAYCRWLSARTGQAWYLPSEAEWERAARDVDGRRYPWGDGWEPERCNSEELGLRDTTPVGCFPDGASRCGALDMAGNVWEWCSTDYRKGYPFIVEDEWSAAYLEASNVARRLRGGSFYFDRSIVRAPCRSYTDPRTRSDIVGVRVASRSPARRPES